MKKIKLSINVGIVGNVDSEKELFHQYLKQIALNSTFQENIFEYLIIHQGVPFKIRLIMTENLDQLISQYNTIENLDALIISINIYDTQAFTEYTSHKIDEFKQKYQFQGLTILAGVDTFHIEKGVPSEYFRISRLNLIKKTNELNFIYCHEIQNKDKDIERVLVQILDEFLLKFQSSNPEVLDLAKNYGNELLNLSNNYGKDLENHKEEYPLKSDLLKNRKKEYQLESELLKDLDESYINWENKSLSKKEKKEN